MLRRLIGATVLMAALVLQANDVRGQGDPAKPTSVDSVTLAPGEYQGALKTTPATDRVFTITVTNQTLVPVTGTTGRPGRMAYIPGAPNLAPAYNNLLKLLTQYQNQQKKVATAKKGSAYNNAVAKLQTIGTQVQAAAVIFQQQAVLAGIRNTAILNAGVGKMPNFRVQQTKKDIDFQGTEEVKVRTMVLPDKFDDKGNVVKYTKEELAELKGKDKKLPGYESSLEKLETGQTVKVTLIEIVKKKDNEANKDAVKEVEKKKQVKLILITAEPPAAKGKK
jgi:hypothetical protein